MRINNLADLEVLVSIADSGSLTAAGKRCGLSTAGVSAALRRLEAALGVRLFERTTRHLTPTPEGVRLTQVARNAFEMISAGQTEICGQSQDEQGLIRVTLSTLLAHSMIPCFGDFVAKHSGIKLDIVASDSTLDLIADRIDLAIRFGPLADSSHVAKLLAPAHRIACASPGYLDRHGRPAEPADLLNHACIVHVARNMPLDSWEFTSVNAANAVPVRIKVNGGLACNHSSTACQMAVQGMGITYNSELAMRSLLESGALVRLFPNHLGAAVPLYAVLPTRRLVPGRVRLLLDSLIAEFAGHALIPRDPNGPRIDGVWRNGGRFPAQVSDEQHSREA
jgi:DNA-binding transcriptional LysR family regulator